MLPACIERHHTGPSLRPILWGAIGYTSRSPLVHSDCTFNSDRYISIVLRLVALNFFELCEKVHTSRTMHEPMFSFLETENVWLLP